MSYQPASGYEEEIAVGQFHGKYRGIVTDNRDPENRGRIRALVPDVYGDQESGWALPCVPYAGKGVGMLFLPPDQSLVWIEFEQGDPDYPIWTGCFWEVGEAPATPTTPERKVLKTDSTTLTIEEAGGVSSLSFETAAGLRVTVNTAGVEITNGTGATIKLSAATVSLNGSALEVT